MGKNKKRTTILISLVGLLLILAVVGILVGMQIIKLLAYRQQITAGNQYLQTRSYDSAEDCYRQAIKMDETKPKAYVQLLELFAASDQYDKAQELLKQTDNRLEESWVTAQEERFIQQQKKEQKAQEEEKPVFTRSKPGEGVVRNGWVAVSNYSNITIYHEGEEKKIIVGTVGYMLLTTNEGLYYGRDNALCFYSYATEKETEIVTGVYYAEPVGVLNGKLYFTGGTDENGDELVTLMSQDMQSGAIRDYTLEEFCSHSLVGIYGERVFYTMGVADVGTSALYELNVDTGRTTKIAENCVNQLHYNNGKIYYCETKERGDSYQMPYTLTELDLETNQKQALVISNAQDLGIPLLVTEEAVYFSRVDDNHYYVESVKKEGGKRNVLWEGKEYIQYIRQEDGSIFISTGDVSSSTVKIYQLDEKTGKTVKVFTIDQGSVKIIEDGNVYYNIINAGVGASYCKKLESLQS